MTLWKTDWSPYRCVQGLHQDNNKMLQQYAHSLEKEKKTHTSIKSVVYPKQLLPLSYISRPYWRTSDTLLTFRSINNYCSLWDAERGFRDFTGKRHNLPEAVKQLQHVLSPSLFVLLWSEATGLIPASSLPRGVNSHRISRSLSSFQWQVWLWQGLWMFFFPCSSPRAMIHLNCCFTSL